MKTLTFDTYKQMIAHLTGVEPTQIQITKQGGKWQLVLPGGTDDKD